MTAAEHRSSVIGHRIVRGAIVILFFGLFLRLGGLMMNWLLNHYYGKGPVLDAYMAVYKTVILALFYSSMLKVLAPAFMPLFAEQRHDKGEGAAWELANTLTNLALLAAAACAATAFLLAPQLVNMLFPEFSAESQDVAVGLLRWMAPGVLAQFFAIMALGVLNSYKIFSYPAAAEATQKLVWSAGIFAAFTLFKVPAIAANAPLVIGGTYLFGCAAQAVVLLTGIGRERLKLYRFSLPLISLRRFGIETGLLAACAGLFAGWAWLMNRLAANPQYVPFNIAFDKDRCAFLTLTGLICAGCLYSAILWYRGRRGTTLMARVAILCAPLMVGVLFARYRDLSRTFFQSYLTKGDFGMIGLANSVAALPGMLVASSLAIAMFPYLSDKAAQKDISHHGAVVGSSVRMLGAVLLPLTALLIVLSGAVMRLLFDKGVWTPEDIVAARLALALLSAGIFFMAIENILMQAFFSLQQMLLPTALGIIISAASSLGLFTLIEGMGIKGDERLVFLLVCLSYSVPLATKNLLLLYFTNRREPVMQAGTTWRFLARLGVICAAVAGAAWAAHAATLQLLARHPIHLQYALDSVTGEPAGMRDKIMAVLNVKLPMLIELALPSLAALAVYVALMALLRMEEMRLVVDYIRRRGWKVRKEAGAAGNGEG